MEKRDKKEKGRKKDKKKVSKIPESEKEEWGREIMEELIKDGITDYRDLTCDPRG